MSIRKMQFTAEMLYDQIRAFHSDLTDSKYLTINYVNNADILDNTGQHWYLLDIFTKMYNIYLCDVSNKGTSRHFIIKR